MEWLTGVVVSIGAVVLGLFGLPRLVWGVIGAIVGVDLVLILGAQRRFRRQRREEEMRARRDFDRKHGAGKGGRP